MTVGEDDQQLPGEVPNYPIPTGAPAPGYAPPGSAPNYDPAAGVPPPQPYAQGAPPAGDVPNYPPPQTGDLYYAPQHHNYDGAPRLGNGFRPEMVEGNWSDGFWNMCGM